MSSPPTGTATFLFTDIEGSTLLLQRLGNAFTPLVEQHHRVLREVFGTHGGYSPRTEGDAFFVVFPSAVHAVAAAVEAQQALAAQRWPADAEVRVRMGLHTGEAILGADDYVGIDVHRAARIAAAAHGGQVLLSGTTRALVADALPGGVSLRDLGEHRLKDLEHPEHLFQLQIAGLRSEFPPLRTLDRPAAHLPTQLTSFVGREGEVAEARRLLASTRLLTLTGPGGTGKTRLSLQLAAVEADGFRDGAYFVALASIAEPDLVASEIVTALGEPDTGVQPPRERLLDLVRDKQLLLVLDNFEQVLGAAPLVADLLKAGPRVSVIATSRSALRVYGEREMPVPPLGLPDPRALPESLQALGQYEAVRLFIDRATAVKPDFQVTNDNAPAVAEICVRLDGLPLAIELAAAGIRLLPPRAMLARLEKRLPLLGAGSRDLPARQQTLRGAIAWSYDLLDDRCRRLFARCSIFARGFDLAACEAVCGPAAELGDMDVLDGLLALVEHSLLRQSDVDGEPRFWMLETIREFAAEQLEASGEADAIAERHVASFLLLAEQAGPELTGHDRKSWLDRLEREHDNFRAALAWCVGRDRAETAMRLCYALWRFWQMRGYLTEGRDRIAQVLALPHGDAHPYARMKALEAAGGLAYWQGDMPNTAVEYDRALAIARELGETKELANALYNLSFAYLIDFSDMDRAKSLLEEARGLFETLGDRAGMARALWGLSIAHLWLAEYEAAYRTGSESLAANREVGDAFGVAWGLHITGLALAKLGDHAAARPLYEEALELFQQAGDISGVVMLLDDVADVELAAGNVDRAIRLAAAGTALIARSGVGLVTLNRGQAKMWEFTTRIPEWQTTPAWAEGATMSADRAVAFALGHDAGAVNVDRRSV